MTYATALPVLDEIIFAPKRRFNLPVASEGDVWVVLHWLGFMLGVPIMQIEAAAQAWARAQKVDQAVCGLWIQGFPSGPVPCIARSALLPFLRSVIASAPSCAPLATALEQRERAAADAFSAASLPLRRTEGQNLATRRWGDDSELTLEIMKEMTAAAKEGATVGEIARRTGRSKSVVSRFLAGRYPSVAAGDFYAKFGIPRSAGD